MSRVSLQSLLLVLLAATLLSLVLARSLTRPVGELTAGAKSMGEGDLSVRVVSSSETAL